ncbi:E3 ubiquitin-protein ligase TRIM56-like [Asterias rubens]|uniref:E3 ubiquitin-protein ligase TRIM56-like n=1 Tax=Asterias rubens TaxID=7604 RepID=UPI0014551DBD|nr:E3 ubiquitin-protein ligase TRIM56-like [Asterias rubens]
MASGVTTASVLDKISQGHLECTICFNRFQTPKVLACSHCFCYACLKEIVSSKSGSSRVLACPVCRKETQLSEKGVLALPDNATMASIIDEINEQEMLMKGQKIKVICQACSEGQDAVSRCLDCEDYLCTACQQAHLRLAKLKSHKITPLYGDQASLASSAPKHTPKCGKHREQDLSLYCEKCQVLICAECIVDEHKQPQHMYYTTEEAGGLFKQAVFKLLATAEAKKTELKGIRDMTVHSNTRLEFAIANTKYKISQTANTSIAYIRQQEQKLHDQVTQTGQERLMTVKISLTNQNEKLATVDQCLETIKTITSHSNVNDLLKKKTKILSDLEEITKVVIDVNEKQRLERLAIIDFTAGVNLVQPLGTIQQ